MHPLAARVRFTHTLRRVDRIPDDYRTPITKAWQAVPIGGSRGARWFGPLSYDPVTDTVSLDGIIVGIRTLSNGSVTYNGEDGTDYRATEHYIAYYVAWHPRRDIVRVLPEHLEVLDV
jgi:hypothetical protein